MHSVFGLVAMEMNGRKDLSGFTKSLWFLVLFLGAWLLGLPSTNALQPGRWEVDNLSHSTTDGARYLMTTIAVGNGWG